MVKAFCGGDVLIALTKVREEAGLTQMALGSLASVHSSVISKIERRRILPLADGAEMTRICMAFRQLGYEVDAASLLEPVDDAPAEAASA